MRFLCLHGSITSADRPGQIEYFGPPPHYRWLDYPGVTEGALFTTVRGARNTSHTTPEEALRSVISNDITWTNYYDLMKYIDETLEKNPDIEGLVGYSEGASIGAAYLLREQQREQETGRTRRIKCAVFLAGIPPVNSERGFIFADEREDMIDLPTVHVVGANGGLVLS
ncbi:hypothetical protein ASPNIDRAFT_42224 [Aspergillus niger ATCC 1015]|uniref:Serine hydrolase domain-containing protein n=1 Tax=Aspergillus niger (strain ATCC 1015 / CBS 113.46 / FGSC A1144 / LSHB Ac4 / NCTC 3858a / NRRL 328 / USDA 3528.7) TaxID=380704 RepID=G3XW17_ASPNA|nr:hypothetical protein ASPNIDRAFT_42224 [Aspergillus niger ATCC 1015]